MSEAILSLMITTLLLLGSPGPATLSLAATGAAVGFKGGYRFLAGILTGLTVAITTAAIGLASLFSSFNQLRIAAQIAGALYIVYLAFRIATSPVLVTNETTDGIAPRFRDGFILNLLNVKAYAAFLAIFSGFLLPLESLALSYLATGIVCLTVATFVDLIWLWFGGVIRPIFSEPRSARILRVVFAVLMVVSVLVVLFN